MCIRDSVYIVQPIGLNPNNEFVEILFWMDTMKRASANSVTAVIPYFGYAKGDKKDEPRVSMRARVCADCIEATGADRVITMDLHSPQVQGFFRIPMCIRDSNAGVGSPKRLPVFFRCLRKNSGLPKEAGIKRLL